MSLCREWVDIYGKRLLNCSLLFLFCLLEQIEVLCSRYEQYLLLLSTMHMYINSLERAAELRDSFTVKRITCTFLPYLSIYSSCFFYYNCFITKIFIFFLVNITLLDSTFKRKFKNFQPEEQ